MAAGSTISREQLDAILGGYHGDPFAVLGPHKVPDVDGWEVRAFLPQALMARVVIDNKAFAMIALDPNGLFAVALLGQPKPYLLEIQLWNGEWTQLEDPFRFSPFSTSFDLHLHSEGTLFHGYNSFGAHLTEVDGHKGTRFTL